MPVFEHSDTSTKVIDIIASELNINKQDVKPSSTFNELGADSLDMVEVIMKVEEQFGVEINDDESERMKTVNDVIEYVQAHRTK